MNKCEETKENYVEECRNKGHRVLLFLGIDRDYHEGRTYYDTACLNCCKIFQVPKGNKEAYRMLEGNFDKKDPMETLEAIEQASGEYHLLRECYYKYPQLKQNEKSDKIIYKTMRKRYETKYNS